MKTYDCTVRRMRVWHVTVEAEDAEEAKDWADAKAADPFCTPDEDYAYETTAREVSE